MTFNHHKSALADSGHSSVATSIDPLVFYESQSVGNEFAAYVPNGTERRNHENRRDQLIVKNWRGVSIERGRHCKEQGLGSMRNSETKRIIDSERMFLIVLATMTILLGSMFAYFVMNFGF